MWKRIALIGFSGAGKSTTARAFAEHSGWRAIDLDEGLERTFGMTIPDVFATHGEPAFRAAERDALKAACAQDHVIIATGGGAAAAHDAWTSELLGNPETLTVTLEADPAVSLRRLESQHQAEGASVKRPMIEGDDPLSRIQRLKESRQVAYDRSRISLIVDEVSPDQVASEIGELLEPVTSLDCPSVRLEAPGGSSNILIAPGSLDRIGEFLTATFPRARKAWIVADENVGRLHASHVEILLAASGLIANTLIVLPGESSKSLAGAGNLYDELLGRGVERTDVIVALGGGVIGDLAGFVAATVLRGIGLVQVPTSLLAMVDSSVGGKTGINHPAGKNLIGSFYQPPLVVIDPLTLRTLPDRELRQGWAEIVKHAVIQPSTPGGERADLLTFLERNAERLKRLEDPALTYLIRRNVSLKSRVVEADERESGIRAYLNFGHTLGHAIEASDYHLLHGEAIALGMRAAAVLSQEVTGIAQDAVDRLGALLDAFGLPSSTNADPARVIKLLQADKKRVRGTQRWVLMEPGVGVAIHQNVAGEQVDRALASVLDRDTGT
jgi:shikimate kinase / 3-dehydroquinate synthase